MTRIHSTHLSFGAASKTILPLNGWGSVGSLLPALKVPKLIGARGSSDFSQDLLRSVEMIARLGFNVQLTEAAPPLIASALSSLGKRPRYNLSDSYPIWPLIPCMGANHSPQGPYHGDAGTLPYLPQSSNSDIAAVADWHSIVPVERSMTLYDSCSAEHAVRSIETGGKPPKQQFAVGADRRQKPAGHIQIE